MKRFTNFYVKSCTAFVLVALCFQVTFVVLDLTGHEKTAKSLSSYFMKKLDSRL